VGHEKKEAKINDVDGNVLGFLIYLANFDIFCVDSNFFFFYEREIRKTTLIHVRP